MNKVTEFLLLFFFAFISMVVLFLFYMGMINTQKHITSQVQDKEYLTECNCLEVSALSNNSIVIKNIGCDFVNNLLIIFPDIEYSYNKTLVKDEIIEIKHNSSFKEQYSFSYNDCI